MRILIDGDACPVVDSIVRITAETGIFVYLFRTYSHFTVHDFPSHVEVKYIDGGRDAVDFMLLQHAKANDIVVTQDYGLASLVLEKVKHVCITTVTFIHPKILIVCLPNDTIINKRVEKQNVIIKGRLHSIKSNDSILKHLFATVSNLHSCACVLTFLVLLHMHFFLL